MFLITHHNFTKITMLLCLIIILVAIGGVLLSDNGVSINSFRIDDTPAIMIADTQNEPSSGVPLNFCFQDPASYVGACPHDPERPIGIG